MATANSELELELTYLVSRLPDLSGIEPVVLEDFYIPEDQSIPPRVRLRRKNDEYEFTKKVRIEGQDASRHVETSIPINKQEFDDLTKDRTRRVTKLRYKLMIDGHAAELDMFTGSLKGLVLIDFEFSSEEDMSSFTQPDICGANVTQEEWVAGGGLAGKTYESIVGELARFSYLPLVNENR